jgi:DNA ligase-1
VRALADYFGEVPPGDGAWALHALLGRQRRRLLTSLRLRQICLEGSGLPDWLFDDCYRQVGDSAETIALLWQQGAAEAGSAGQRSAGAEASLQQWMEELLPPLATLDPEPQARAMRALWQGLEPIELLVVNKLLTGGLRVGVAEGLVVQALAQLSGLEPARLRHRLMGELKPSAAQFCDLLDPAADEASLSSRPYPFQLACPLEPGRLEDSDASRWQLEWKWDGIRAQLIRRGGQCWLWSRGEELIHPAFPELLDLGETLPDGLALDGEVIIWPPAAPCPQPFAELQKRLGRKAPSRALLAQSPAAFVAYDLLELGGCDRRHEPLRQRRAALEALHQQLLAAPSPARAGLLRLSNTLPLQAWDELEALRAAARAAGAEGLMLKDLDSPYLVGRRRGPWWKHKLEPLRLDAVLLYAQAGSGRRANLYTDYTFGLWDRPGDSSAATGEGSNSQPPALVSFAKAYSGLSDGEIVALDRWIRSHTLERFGPVRAVQPLQVFELAFEGIGPSKRHKSGLAVRFPRISRWRQDKPAAEADCLAAALALMQVSTNRQEPSEPPC